jgi:hypothetical protein
MQTKLRPIPNDPRRLKKHEARKVLKNAGDFKRANRLRRHEWKAALRGFRHKNLFPE